MSAGAAEAGLGAGLALTTFFIGLRHGVDWDHIAALADINGSTRTASRGRVLSFAYVAGHALAVAVLGSAAVVAGNVIPAGLDRVMGSAVGVTLILLGAYVLVALAREGKAFRMRSRWIIVFHAARRLVGHIRGAHRTEIIEIEHEHEHEHANESHGHSHDEPRAATSGSVELGVTLAPPATRHRHTHRHVVTTSSGAYLDYGPATVIGIGVIHGVGAETPTQLALLAAAAGTDKVTGLVLVGAFIAGLVVSNSAVAVLAGFGLSGAKRNFKLYAGVAVVTAALSVLTGVLLVTS